MYTLSFCVYVENNLYSDVHCSKHDEYENSLKIQLTYFYVGLLSCFQSYSFVLITAQSYS
jgi:hypothetical protein